MSPALSHSHKRINRRLNTSTRKNSKQDRDAELAILGFMQRMSEPVSFTILNPSDTERRILDSKVGPILTDDEKWELYINGKD